jgi:hypothetical protein
MARLYVKDPQADLKYVVDWTDWLASGETISTSTFTVPSGLTKVSESNTTTAGTVRISGGSAGTTYRIVHQITTSASQTDQRSFDLRIEDR